MLAISKFIPIFAHHTKPYLFMIGTKILLFGLGTSEILVIALVVLLLFGGKKIPELMKGLGKGVKSFKEGMNEVTDSDSDEKKQSGKDE